MMKIIGLIAVFAMAAGLTAADVSGKWIGDIPSRSATGSPTVRIYLTIERSGDVITGTIAYKDEWRSTRIENPSLKGDQLTFEIHDNPSRVVTFTFLVFDDHLSGEATSANGKFEITMKRPS